MLCLRRMLDMSSSLLSAFPNSEYSYSFLHRRNRKKMSSTYVTASIGLAISDNKVFLRRQNRRNKWFVPADFLLFRGTENSLNSVPNHSAEEANALNSVLCNKNRFKLSEFRYKPFRRRQNHSEFCPVKQK
jgi:hypothetical protein